jgi:Raf kinase inhibitor-like YbhB/YbcL family protein
MRILFILFFVFAASAIPASAQDTSFSGMRDTSVNLSSWKTLDTPRLEIRSSSFDNNGMIPAKYSCEGENISPALTVTGIPPGTKSLSLVLHDPDAPMNGGFTHWVVWNIDPDGDFSGNIAKAQQGLNDSKKQGYTGMCPPSGTHRYYFRVYALDNKLNLGKGTNRISLEKAMDGHILGQGELVGLYAKTK